MWAVWFGASPTPRRTLPRRRPAIHERAVEHGPRRLLVGHLIDEHVARILGGVRVEGRHDDSVLPSLLEDRRDRVEIDCRKRDRVGLLGQEILERLDLKRDVGVVGARVDKGSPSSSAASLPPRAAARSRGSRSILASS